MSSKLAKVHPSVVTSLKLVVLDRLYWLDPSIVTEEVFNLCLARKCKTTTTEVYVNLLVKVCRLLREAQPELMDDLIQASKDGDQSKLQELSGTGACKIEEDEEEETECEDEEESNIIAMASRWFDGLVDKDSDITNEVYSIHSVEFDRQELRKLVRRVHTIQSQQLTEENEAAMSGAKKSLVRFLLSIAKQTECD
ncbi:kinesin-like protein [Thalictrum thalictroides]|uniref:Kinesin-like protein n=1 Tax=Thalictrum thalictroides TaxID=46969 RepID=A0A7J6WHI9_THATH|nr:kinesin-like protein [Thalictrum thalictroides]